MRSLKVYQDGAVARLHNRSVMVKEIDGGGYYLQFQAFDKTPGQACRHRHIRNCIRETTVKLTEEAVEAIITAYLAYKKHKNSPDQDQVTEYTFKAKD